MLLFTNVFCGPEGHFRPELPSERSTSGAHYPSSRPVIIVIIRHRNRHPPKTLAFAFRTRTKTYILSLLLLLQCHSLPFVRRRAVRLTAWRHAADGVVCGETYNIVIIIIIHIIIVLCPLPSQNRKRCNFTV